MTNKYVSRKFNSVDVSIYKDGGLSFRDLDYSEDIFDSIDFENLDAIFDMCEWILSIERELLKQQSHI